MPDTKNEAKGTYECGTMHHKPMGGTALRKNNGLSAPQAGKSDQSSKPG